MVEKRKPPAAGKGRVKGVPNRITKELNEMILGALDGAGGRKYLQEQADKNPTAFLSLIGKVLPMTLASDATQPLVVKIVKFSESDIVG